MTSLLLYIALAFGLPAGAAHDFHVSRLTVDHDTKQQRLKLTLQTFVDDFERGIIEEHQLANRQGRITGLPDAADVNLLEPKQHAATDSLAEAYLRRHLSLRIGKGPELAWRLVGMERSGDPYGMFVYLTVLGGPRGEEAVRLRSTMLTSVFPDQQNVVIWQRDGEAVDYDLLTLQTAECTWSR